MTAFPRVHLRRLVAALLGISLFVAGLVAVQAPTARADTGCPTAAGSYARGAGTAVSPWQIDDSAQLQRLRNDSATGWDDSFILTADIDMGGCTWTSTIGNATLGFTGRLDGGGNDVSGLTVAISTSTANAYGGLIGRLRSPGVVTRIGFSGNVSAVTTYMYYTNSAYAGGLVGYADTGTTISYSTASGSVSATASGNNGGSRYTYAGGLVGYADTSTISDSFATGAAGASAANIGGTNVIEAGGLVGDVTGGSVLRSYSTGTATVSGGSINGGFVGSRGASTFTNDFYDTTTSSLAWSVGNGSATGVTGKTTAELKLFATYHDSSWDIVNGWQSFDPGNAKVWGICAGSTRAFLLWQYAVNPCASAPGAPAITSVSPSMTSANVAFTADDSGGSTITRLEFALDDTATVDDSTTNLVNPSPFTLSGLTTGTTYRVFMRAVNAIGTGPWSAGTSFRTLAVPGAPTISSVTPAMTGASVAFTADDSGGSTITRLEFALDDTATVDDSTTNLVSPFTLSGLSGGVSYRVFMRAVNVAGTGPWSAGTLFRTLNVPGAPTVTGVTPAMTSASVAFTADDSGGSTITRLEFALDDTATVDDSTTNLSSPFTLSGLSGGVSYRVFMRAVNVAGTGPWSAGTLFRTLNVPGAPAVTGVTPAMSTAGVAFTADDSGGSQVTRLEFALDDTATVDDSTTNLVSPFTLNGLSAGTSYRVFMRAVNVWGTGPWSAGTLFTTPAPPAPVPASAPTRVVAVGSDGRVEVRWQEPSSSGSYPVMQYLATATPGGRTCLTAETSCTITGLANGTAYTVSVQALTGVGWSTASAPSNTVTPRGPDAKTLRIVGSRGEGSAAGTITIDGTSTGLVGAAVTLKIMFPGQAPTTSTTPITVASDGTFAWSRKTNKQVRIVALAGGIRSTPVTIPAR